MIQHISLSHILTDYEPKEESEMRNQLTLTLFILIIAVTFCSIAVANLQNGLIVYYPFDESNGKTASDNSKNNNDGELLGSAAWAPNEGKIDGAARFDGGEGSVVDDNGADYINGLEAFSISVWVKSDSVGHDRGIVFAIDPTGGDNIFGLRYDAASWSTKGGTNLIKGAITTTGGGQAYEGKSEVQITEWQHLVFTWKSGEKLALYINAELDDDPTHNDAAVEGSISGATKFIVGKGAKDNNGTSWTGLIDEVRIYDRVLSDGEIAELATGVLPVEPAGKITTTWGNIKQKLH
ncbi:LamG domain-containing protein [Candidatus Poribacteria bacterium]|nr:LamG domain-containing protein [Candidatus Poribacteria bacterium]